MERPYPASEQELETLNTLEDRRKDRGHVSPRWLWMAMDIYALEKTW